MRKPGVWVKFLLAVFAVLAVPASFLLLTLANFSDNVDRFIFYVKTQDQEMAKRELIGLHYFYDLSRQWKVQWLADKYLFSDASFYEIADLYLIGNWEKVIVGLKDKTDDPRSYHFGHARFRDIQGKVQTGHMPMEEALKFVTQEVAGDFELALRNCLNSGADYLLCYDRVWNYDLATNKKNAEEALRAPKPEIPFILVGPPKDPGGEEPLPKSSPGGKEDGKSPGNNDKRRP